MTRNTAPADAIPPHGHDHPEHAHDHAHGHAPGHDHDHDQDHGHDHGHGHHHGRPRPRRNGILLAAFGVALPEARDGYEVFAAEVRKRFPDCALRLAFTANKVRRKLAARGAEHDSVAVALSRLHDEGVTHLAVQSLHTVPGVEYHWTMDQALVYRHPRKGFAEVRVGGPLLMAGEDLDRVRLGLGSYIPADRRPDEAVILVAHGTYHQGHQRYLDWEARVREHDPRVHLGTLMGRPDCGDILDRLGEGGTRRVWLVPFMSVPGHHVRVDVYGEGPGSWKSRLEAAGFRVMTRLTGTLEHAPFREVWMDHLRATVAALSESRPT